MKPFRYVTAHDVQSAVAEVAGARGARFLGGGTNLVDLMKHEVETPEVLVDVSRLPIARIEELEGGGLRVGGAVRNCDLAADRRVRERYPLLAQALTAGASGQIRNLATVAGNLLQRTRCGYFQDASVPCNKRAPGSGCPARDGDHRNHAILGHSTACVATHPSDMAVALLALDAGVRVHGPGGSGTFPLAGLHRLPGEEPERDTVLAPEELITAIDLPPAPAAPSRYRKVRDRASFAFAIVSVAVALEVVGGAVGEVRIAFGGVAHRPWRAAAAEAALRGGPADEAAFGRAADAELAHAQPLPGNRFKVPLLRAVLIRTLSELREAQA